ncbi:hypothetical protein [Paenibacillus sp. MBLB4367]|uniref:hypothetical protein n=1 Tax=Paenibacillus sp. MBLB4367 TaxID=3384767 RepID=UPI0039080422
MRKGIIVTVSAALSFILITGCSSFSSTEQASAPPQATNNVSTNLPKQTEATPGGSADAAQTEKPPTPSNPPAKINEKDQEGQQQGNSTKQGEGGDKSPQPKETPSGNQAGTGTAKVTKEQVKEKYAGQLEDLKSYYSGQLQSLYNQAMASKQNEPSKSDLYDTYLKKAAALEEESQAKVNRLLQQMKEELTKQSLAADSVNELRSAYYAEMAKVKESFAGKVKAG